jgi:hypothetical protein
MKYSEPQMIELIKSMTTLYLESYPADQEQLQRFLDWVLQQWGYQHGQS